MMTELLQERVYRIGVNLKLWLLRILRLRLISVKDGNKQLMQLVM